MSKPLIVGFRYLGRVFCEECAIEADCQVKCNASEGYTLAPITSDEPGWERMRCLDCHATLSQPWIVTVFTATPVSER